MKFIVENLFTQCMNRNSNHVLACFYLYEFVVLIDFKTTINKRICLPFELIQLNLDEYDQENEHEQSMTNQKMITSIMQFISIDVYTVELHL
jgi:hypothetical protein